MLPHIDGGKHQRLNNDRWYDLIVILDDGASDIYYAQLVEEKPTRRFPCTPSGSGLGPRMAFRYTSGG